MEEIEKLTEIMKKEVITLPQVKKILEEVKPDEMDQIQRWTYDYVRKFAKTDQESAERMVKRLVDECDIKPEEAIEIVNIMPISIEELRAFTYGWKKLILTETLEKMLSILRTVQ
jgi:DNA-directed RNA polymerase subunit F